MGPPRAVRVVCVKCGEKYGCEYVAKLKSMVDRHLSLPHTFECFTDFAGPQVASGVRYHALRDQKLTTWWAKLEIFRPGEIRSPTLYLDLDVVLTSSLDWIEKYLDCDLAAAHDWGGAKGGNKYDGEIAGCLMVMSGRGKTDEIYTLFDPDRDIRRLAPHGDQTWITEIFGDRTAVIPPGKIVSYKRHCQDGPPEGASLVAFHGRPKPDEVDADWVRECWR